MELYQDVDLYGEEENRLCPCANVIVRELPCVCTSGASVPDDDGACHKCKGRIRARPGKRVVFAPLAVVAAALFAAGYFVYR